ncbi:SpaH/EbpB family LPXTG-anchored major pilin [Corynebacterium sp. HMSC074A01]|uniref:SpaH/EbpB family LPXTG-anchored major pilin n=1 Tax=Corynebacterium sp. HMSC074A01 TaxID=1715030 RepID=UPI0008A12D33|nr:SpaH/EbpB family LPXTG-anchored major pilin [Corynebacterium sp. HMSC074A01]OHF36333.1 hypothetical protein HMPREF2550_08510 [Corynebacterium sp. HMSC074A01]
MANAFTKTAAIAVAAGLTLAGSAGIATDAIAQETPAHTSNVTGAGIDSSKSLSLTLHKKKLANDQQPGEQANGQEMQGVPGTGLDGVEYKLDLVKSLKTDQDWQEAAKTYKDNKTADILNIEPEKANVASGTTANGGNVKFENLERGLYRVVETKAPAGVVPGAPFLVYVPMTNKDGTDWVYDVHAYPKNTENTVTKEVKDEWANAGDEYTYTLSTGVPAGTLTKYVVRDTLHEKLAAPTEENVKVEGFTVGTDYQVNIDGQKVEVEFTEAGRKKLQAGTQVKTTITAKTKEAVQHIPNQGTLIYNNGSSEHDVEQPTNEVHTYWGNLKVTKTDEGTKPLAGAEFELVRCQGGEGKPWTQVADTGAQNAYSSTGDTTKPVKKFVTGDDGTVTISGIHVEDFENNSAENVKTNFCLKETKAPKGYIADDKLIPFELKRGEVNKETGAPVKTIESAANVKNIKSPNTLPNTGGMGVLIIVLAGLAIIGGGVYAARRNSQSA